MIAGRKVQMFIPAASSGFREGLEIIYPLLSVLMIEVLLCVVLNASTRVDYEII